MRNNLFLTLLLLCTTSLLFLGCNEDDGPSISGTMTATVNGESWEAEMPAGSYQQSRMGIAGTSTDDMTIVISLDYPTLEATSFQLNQGSLSAIAYTESTGATAHTSNGSAQAGGNVVITSVDTANMLISGTFESLCFRAVDQSEVDITDGVFTDITYTETLNPTDDSMLSVDIDGQPWTAVSVTGGVSFGRLSISASDQAVDQTVGFSLPEDISAGTYSFQLFGTVTGLYNINNPTLVTYGATSGTLTISSHDLANKTISGTFDFEAADDGGTGTNTVSLTNGEFSLAY
ncbi:MAG: DUF6252 family protein [Lewinella sp.]|uniref:DUF6252 family protein n=1 Tax=Lewinella sp. TaxID=2004506 RepID=UPI003D6B3309